MPVSDTLQEIAALVIVASAVIYLSSRLTGWPRLRRKGRGQRAASGAPVQVGARLARGLEASKRRRSDAGE